MSGSVPKISTKIPYNLSGNLGAEYNRLMEESTTEWTLFLDHDVLLCNPHWYYICERVIEENPDAGMFTCYTNAISCRYQVIKSPKFKSTVKEHIDFAMDLFENNKYSVDEIPELSGLFMLVKKKAWADVGGFENEGFFTIDRKFSRKIRRSDYGLYRINGLYVYHIYKDKPKLKVEGSKLSEDFK